MIVQTSCKIMPLIIFLITFICLPHKQEESRKFMWYFITNPSPIPFGSDQRSALAVFSMKLTNSWMFFTLWRYSPKMATLHFRSKPKIITALFCKNLQKLIFVEVWWKLNLLWFTSYQNLRLWPCFLSNNWLNLNCD